MAIPSQSFLSEEGCHWFDVGLSPDVFILDVVLLGLASSSSQHSHLNGVQLLGINCLNYPAFTNGWIALWKIITLHEYSCRNKLLDYIHRSNLDHVVNIYHSVSSLLVYVDFHVGVLILGRQLCVPYVG